MTPPFDPAKPGQSLSAANVNRALAEVERAGRVTAQPPLRVTSAHGGVHFHLDAAGCEACPEGYEETAVDVVDALGLFDPDPGMCEPKARLRGRRIACAAFVWRDCFALPESAP